MNFTRLASLIITLTLGATGTASADQQREQAERQAARTNAATKLDLNTADAKALAALPEIGPDLAAAIVAARPFATVDDLNRVNGITAERLELIRAKVAIIPTQPPVGDGLLDTPAQTILERAPREKPKVDLNHADAAALESIAGLGSAASHAIIAARPFKSLDDLSRVQGLTAEQLEHIRTQATVTPPTSGKKRAKNRG